MQWLQWVQLVARSREPVKDKEPEVVDKGCRLGIRAEAVGSGAR